MKKLILFFILLMMLNNVYAGRITAYATFDVKKPIDIKIYKDNEYRNLRNIFNLNENVYVKIEINGKNVENIVVKLNGENVDSKIEDGIYYFDFRVLEEKEHKINVDAIVDDKKFNEEKIVYVSKASEITGNVVKQNSFSIKNFFKNLINRLLQ